MPPNTTLTEQLVSQVKHSRTGPKSSLEAWWFWRSTAGELITETSFRCN